MAHTYEIRVTRAGKERVHRYSSDTELVPGDVIVLDGRHWLVERLEPSQDGPPNAFAKPARYRLRLRYPHGREDLGAFRRYRPDAPKLGHAFTTMLDGSPVNWEVVDVRLAHDENGEPYLDLAAKRDWSEPEELLDHELEHTLEAREWSFPEAAEATLARAEREGLSVELAALDPGEEPDWAEAERYIDALILVEIEDDLLELAGVDLDHVPRQAWLDTVKGRLREDLDRFRADVEGDHDDIEEWSFRGGRVLASVGSADEEGDPDSAHGWMCRLLDASALGAAGFVRVRKVELQVD
jgi:hypothetical protein